jgi:hypothetical protein
MGAEARLPTRLNRTLTARPGRTTPTTSSLPAGYGRFGSSLGVTFPDRVGIVQLWEFAVCVMR